MIVSLSLLDISTLPPELKIHKDEDCNSKQNETKPKLASLNCSCAS